MGSSDWDGKRHVRPGCLRVSSHLMGQTQKVDLVLYPIGSKCLLRRWDWGGFRGSKYLLNRYLER